MSPASSLLTTVLACLGQFPHMSPERTTEAFTAKFASVSGEYSASVSARRPIPVPPGQGWPHDPENAVGPIHFVLEYNGEQAWSTDLHGVFLGAAVSNTGVSACVFYTKPETRIETEAGRDPRGSLNVIIFRNTGVAIQNHSVTRIESNAAHASATPLYLGIALSDAADVLLVRVSPVIFSRDGEWWWIYSLRTGVFQDATYPWSTVPTQQRDARICDIIALDSTPVFVVNWTRGPEYHDKTIVNPLGDFVTVMDSKGRCQWSFDIPGVGYASRTASYPPGACGFLHRDMGPGRIEIELCDRRVLAFDIAIAESGQAVVTSAPANK
jgi:hypothetical protein